MRRAFAIVVVLLVGCGGDDDATPNDDSGSFVDSAIDTATDGTTTDTTPSGDAPATDGAADVKVDASDSGGCATTPFAHGTWPPACYRPFADSSPFNTKLPVSPKLIANSDKIVRRVLGLERPIVAGATQIANFIALDDHTSGWPTYWALDTDPVFKIQCNEFGGACSDAASGITLHAPAGALIQGGCGADVGSDRHLTVIDQGTGWEYDLWHVSTCPLPAAGGTIQIGWGGRARIDGDGIDTDGGEGMASYTANLAGRVRAEELAAHRIDHALNIVIDCGDGTSVYPAKKGDKKCTDTLDAPPMGARFQLAMTAAEIDALPAPAWKKTLLHAAADYGMFFGDTGSSFFFDIQTEGGNQYTSMGADDLWLTMAKAEGWSYTPSGAYKGYTGTFHNGDDGLDWRTQVWSKLRVIDPCVSQKTCP